MSRMILTIAQAAEVVGGQVIGALTTVPQITGVSTDSRTTSPGDVFVALKGERFDGHDFVEQAAAAGAVAAVVERPVSAAVPQVVVADTLVALGKLAAWWRRQVPATVLAVTGSAGKTTTKSMLAEILRRVAATVSTPGTENNEIGVPLTLLATRDEKYCVLEFGARGLGHIAYLAGIARPDIGIITNIGQAHLGLFGSPEKVARAKAELLEALPEHGTAVLPADDAFFEQLCQRCHCRVVSFGFGEADFRAGDVALRGEGVAFVLRSPVGTAEIKLRVPGRHNALNALAAAAAAWAGGASLDAIVDGLQAFEGEPMRTEIVRLADGTLVINDAYNASPTSVAAALELLSSYSGRKVFVFGDMLELGDHAAAAHRQVGQAAVSAGVAVLIAVGELAAMAADEASRLGIRTAVAANPSEAVPVAAELVRPGDIVLVKASRLVGLEAVVRALEEARGRA